MTRSLVSNRIGCTKILEIIWMTESKRMVSGKQGGENLSFFQPNANDVPSGQFGKKFISILSVELDGIRARKWNAKWVIIFQSVILQCVRLFTGAKNIRAIIEFRLNSWNHGAFEKLINDTYTAATGYLGRARGTQSEEQRHRTFSDIVLRQKLREADRCFCK